MLLPVTEGRTILITTLMIHQLSGAWEGLLRLFYPKLCAGCGTDLAGGEKVLCLSCNLRLPRTEYHHIRDNRSFQNFTGRLPIEQATSFVYFAKQGLVQHLMHQFKYRGRKDIGDYLGQLFAVELKKVKGFDTIDMIVPVPLHRRKVALRGYNQAQIFAEGLAAGLGVPVLSGVIERIKATETQTHKTRAERLNNVSNVFRAKRTEAIRGKHLLLVDDVLTTGATLESCALELLRTKNTRISIVTLAVAMD